MPDPQDDARTTHTDASDPQCSTPIPPLSSRDQPRFATRDRRDQLARAFDSQGADYDRLRPNYPPSILRAILSAARTAHPQDAPGRPRIVDLGAGTGKLTHALAAGGADLIAVDPSRSMLDQLTATAPGAGTAPATARIRVREATAESTGLPAGQADAVTAAQAWHWFDTDAASAEAHRLLRPGGTLALVWNTLDVQIPWVHRLARIMHAGDVQKDDFTPPVDPAHFALAERLVHRWQDPRPTAEIIALAQTRSYVATASPARRERVRANLDWYLHEHLGHAPGSIIGLPYRTDLFLYTRRA